MKQITLNNGITIPQIGFGVFQTPVGETTQNAVKWALEAGYRHIDTAMIYENEEDVGTAIIESKIPREDIFLTTKLWNEDIRQGRAKEAFAASLKALKTDYVDLYLIHWPAQGFEKAWLELEELYQKGKIKAIGISNFHPVHYESLKKIASVTPVVNQIESHPYFPNDDLIAYSRENGMEVEAWSPLGGTNGPVLQNAVLQKIAEKYGKSPAQIVIRWHMQRDVIVLPKSVHKERIEANLEVEDFVLSEDDMQQMNALNCDMRIGAHPETFDF